MGLWLEVKLYGILVGTLSRNRNGAIRFELDPQWLAGEQLPRLGLAFARDASPRVAGTGVPAWFENLLPEPQSRLRSRLCAQLGLRETDSPGLLVALGADLPGAVVVRGQRGDETEPEPVETTAPNQPWRFSLAGMQLKLSMSLVNERLTLPSTNQDGDWLVKLPGPSYEELPAVEHATLRWAALAGFEVPESRVLPSSALTDTLPEAASYETVFAIRRFDRPSPGTRIHQEDFAQVLELDSRHKYGNTGPRHMSYDGLARLIKDAGGEASQREYVRRLALIVACGNTDAHLKNFSYQWPRDAKRPRLSPLYDMVSTISWSDFGWDSSSPELGLALGRTRRFDELDLGRIRTFCTRGEVEDGERLFVQTLEAVQGVWLKEVKSWAPQRMVEAVEKHWRRVPLLRKL